MTTPTNTTTTAVELARRNVLRDGCSLKLKRRTTRANLPWALEHLGSSAVLAWAWQQWTTRGLKAVAP